EAFGDRAAASITPQDIERWFAAAGRSRNKDKFRTKKPWRPATFNRYKALISLVYREGVKNGRVSVNPARQVQRRRENNERVRYLTDTEEAALRSVMERDCPERLPELEIALNTGMRRGEQFACDWSWVDFDQR